MNRTTQRRHFDRRGLLRFGAGGALAVAAAQLARVRGAEGAAPPRFVFIYTPAGREPSWRTGVVAGPPRLSATMAMFEAYRNKMCLIEGLTIPNFGYEKNAHWAALHCLLGGKSPLTRPGNAGGALSEGAQRTFDHLLADRLGKSTPVSNVVLGGTDRNNENGSLLASWSGPRQAQFPIHDPDKAFALLFGGAGAAPMPGGTAGGEDAARARQWEQDVLGLSRASGGLFRKQLGSIEARHLEAYEAGLHQAWTKAATEGPEIVAEATSAMCRQASLGALTMDLPTASYTRQHDLQSRILAAALACGRTRVGVYVMAGIRSGMTVPGGQGGHHLHNDGAAAHYRAFDTYYGHRVKFLLDELARYPEGDGTVLDNTIVVWSSDISWTPVEHDHDNIPFYLFGGLGGKLKMGQYVKLPYDTFGNNRVAALASPRNRRTHEVLLTIAGAMGIRDLDGFADPKYVTGPVKELLP